MAVDLWSDTNCSSSLGMSPRISFSHDLSQCDVIPVEQSVFRSSSSGIEFDFCTHYGSNEQESSSADELFSGGKLLPMEVKRKSLPQPSLPPPPPQGKRTPSSSNSHPDVAKTTSTGSDEKQTSKSFWRFKRSNSLNCAGSGYARSLCPLPLLLRSNSTGSSGASVKRSSQPHVKSCNGGSVASPLKPPPPSTNQKPPLRKNYNTSSSSSSTTSGVRIMNPALNVHSGNLFGLGSIFSGGKDRNKKK